MDIVNRLKIFMNQQGIANSQFADTCRIPRPTLSQLLSGRNKKISDELISKIHLAFPQLSVLWLMFGEGNMLVDGNIEISDAQSSSLFNGENDGSVDDTEQNLFSSMAANQSMRSSQTAGAANQSASQSSPSAASPNPVAFFASNQPSAATPTQLHYNPEQGSVEISADASRRITNIVVFYSDNSFQSFSPTA